MPGGNGIGTNSLSALTYIVVLCCQSRNVLPDSNGLNPYRSGRPSYVRWNLSAWSSSTCPCCRALLAAGFRFCGKLTCDVAESGGGTGTECSVDVDAEAGAGVGPGVITCPSGTTTAPSAGSPTEVDVDAS